MHLIHIGLATIAAIGSGPAPAAPDLVAIRATTVVVGAGEAIENGTVLIEGDSIRAVGTDVAVPEGTVVIEHDGFLTAGIVAPHSTLLPGDERADETDPFMAEAELRFGFDPEREAVERALHHGVTTAVLTADSTAVVGGLAAVVQTHGATVLEPRSHLSLSMNGRAVRADRYPTSYAGLVRELGRRFGPDAEGAYARARSGELPVLIAVDGADEVQRALAFAGANGLRGALLGARRAGEQLEALRESGLGVVYSVFGTGLDQRSLDAMVAVADSDVPFAFALTDPTLLRFSGASLVRAGASADRVWGALTEGGAAIAGVADRIGRLERGKRADLCLWSGHPLELTSTLEGVWVGGHAVEVPAATRASNDGADQ